MKKTQKQTMTSAVTLTILAVLAIILVAKVDVQPVGVEGTNLGFATMNTNFFKLTGESPTFYKISKYSMYFGYLIAAGFSLLFLYQLIRRKSLKAIDPNLKALLLLYIATALVFLIFNKFPINYRPIIRDKGLESSFPSTHALMAVVIFFSASDQWKIYIKNKTTLFWADVITWFLAVLIILSRLLAGVHWLTDILGGIIIGLALLAWYNVLREKWSKPLKRVSAA